MGSAIEIQNLSYEYSDNTIALSNITLAIEHGQKVALIGPNGAGKSTLLLAIAGFTKGKGTVFVDGIKVERKNLKQIRTTLACCLENPDDQLFMPTLFDDVSFGPLNMGLSIEEVKKRTQDALQTVGLTDMANKAPHHLSAGQKRAAAIATLLSMSPKIITFDEPDGNLDPRNRKKLVQLLKNLSQTLIVATCNMAFAATFANRAVLLDKGSIVADGNAKEIMSNSILMSEHGLEVPYNLK